ncbi:hypothetical protein [Roseibium sp.]|uniref:hypothetical protein n=1 Tax=Roseibium sp. TaxID=1936156 RepID=UPI003B501733
MSRLSLQLIAVCCANSTKLMGPAPSPRRQNILCPLCISLVFLDRKSAPAHKSSPDFSNNPEQSGSYNRALADSDVIPMTVKPELFKEDPLPFQIEIGSCQSLRIGGVSAMRRHASNPI